jgi:AsmA protein
MRWIIAAGAIVAALLLAAIATPFLIDVNKFRPTLESKASLALGRNVKLGNLRLSILSGKVIANDIAVEDNPAFSKSPFLSARSVAIGVEMMPLIFSRQLNVTGIIIEHPEITLLRAADGTYNFSNLGKDPANDLKQAGSALQAISVRKLILDHGKLMLGRVDSASSYRVYEDFNIEISTFSSTSEFPFRLTTNLPGGGDATLTGHAGPINALDLADTPFEALVKTTGTNIATYGFIDPASGIAGLASSDLTIRSDGTTQTLTGTLRASGMKFSPTGVPLPSVISIKHKAELNLQQQSVKISAADLSIGSAIFHLTGVVEKLSDERTLNCELTTSNAPMDEVQTMLRALDVKLPLGSHLQGGTTSMKLSITGTAASPVASGPIQVTDSKLLGFNLGEQLGKAAAFAGKAASAPDTLFSSLVFDLKATRAGFQLNNIHAQIPSVGEAIGSGTISPDRMVDFKLTAYPSGGMAGKLTKLAATGGGNEGVPVTIKGTLEKPIIVADVSAGHTMAAEAAKGVASSTAHSIGKIFGKKK